MNNGVLPNIKSNPMDDDQLLDFYLSLSKQQREHKFIDTTCAAEITGLSKRTIQFWIDCGFVRALNIGRKYRIDRDSLREYLTKQMSKKNQG